MGIHRSLDPEKQLWLVPGAPARCWKKGLQTSDMLECFIAWNGSCGYTGLRQRQLNLEVWSRMAPWGVFVRARDSVDLNVSVMSRVPGFVRAHPSHNVGCHLLRWLPRQLLGTASACSSAGHRMASAERSVSVELGLEGWWSDEWKKVLTLGIYEPEACRVPINCEWASDVKGIRRICNTCCLLWRSGPLPFTGTMS